MNLVKAALLVWLSFQPLNSAPLSQWTLMRSPHFEVYSQAGERNAEATLLWLERLRAFFVQAGVAKAGAQLERYGPVRVIVFRSEEEYLPFRPDASADAFYLSGPGRDCLVMPALGSQQFGVAAHEYAHLMMHSIGLKLPPWLAEGISEFFSTVRISERESFIGGDLPARTLALRQSAWMPLEDLFSATLPMRADRQRTNVFYAESWLLTDMLIFSPKYSPQFAQFMGEIARGSLASETIARVYGKTLTTLGDDLRAWMQTSRSAEPLPGVPGIREDVRRFTLDDFRARTVLAELLAASARLNEAEAAYRALARERPNDANAHAVLATIALRKGEERVAREQWQLAVDLGIADAPLCYTYANLAEDAGFPAGEVRSPLRRAIELAPDFDDARYKLALLENTAGDFRAALAQFRVIRSVPATRAYAYWTALASALTEMDEREEAKKAADNALRYAATAEERITALRLRWMAATDLTVQLSRDANGNMQVVTARKPHGSNDWNPFIEPGDQIHRLEGKIQKVECESGKITGFRVENESTAVEVTLPDPAHVLIQGGTPEFVCGAEDGRKVDIEYAESRKQDSAVGILRGMTFR